MIFPSLFYGEKCPDDVIKNFTYQNIAQWEVQHIDHDFTYHVTNLFYKVVLVILNHVFSSMWIRIRKGKLKGRKLIEKDVKSKPNLDRILELYLGYMDLRTIHTSQHYLKQLHKIIYAMIRQLGSLTFFCFI